MGKQHSRLKFFGYLEVGLMKNGLKSFFRAFSSFENWKMR